MGMKDDPTGGWRAPREKFGDYVSAKPVDTVSAEPVDTVSAEPVDTVSAEPVDTAASRMKAEVDRLGGVTAELVSIGNAIRDKAQGLYTGAQVGDFQASEAELVVGPLRRRVEELTQQRDQYRVRATNLEQVLEDRTRELHEARREHVKEQGARKASEGIRSELAKMIGEIRGLVVDEEHPVEVLAEIRAVVRAVPTAEIRPTPDLQPRVRQLTALLQRALLWIGPGDPEARKFLVAQIKEALDDTLPVSDRITELEEENRRYRKAHVCTADCRPNAHVAFEGRQLVDQLQARVTELENLLRQALEHVPWRSRALVSQIKTALGLEE